MNDPITDMSSIDGLFIAPNGEGWPCVWHESSPGHERPEFVMAQPYGSRVPMRRLWDVLVAVLPEREAAS